MAIHTVNVTLGAAKTQVTSTHTPCKQAYFYNDTGNAAVKVGDKNITTDNYGFQVPVINAAVGEQGISPPIGPFSGEQAFNLDEIWLLGTQNNIVRVFYVT